MSGWKRKWGLKVNVYILRIIGDIPTKFLAHSKPK